MSAVMDRTAAALLPLLLAAVALVTLDPPRWAAASGLCAAAVATGALVELLVRRPRVAEVARVRQRADQLEVELVAERAAGELAERLDRALRATENEPETLRTGLRAVGELLRDREVSLLLSVPGDARVGWSVDLVDGLLDDARPLAGTPGCVALQSGTTAAATAADALDACAHLRTDHAGGSALCVPLRAGGSALGTICVQGPPGELPDERTRRRLEWIAQRVGARVGELRDAHGPAGTGRPDPLTGLPRQLALREHLRQQVRSLAPFSLAVLAVDGHDALPSDAQADGALRAVAEALSTTLRPDDFLARLDGARLAAVLHGCDPERATAALERVRETLVLRFAMVDSAPASGPDELAVTFSAGVVGSPQAASLDELVQLADAACERAAASGGNRVDAVG